MRVIAGSLGGRRLTAPRGRATRPTSDRVREAMFSSLGPLDGLRVADLYAGSGALAIEALSRGAKEAVCVERSAQALKALRRNLTELGVSAHCHVLATNVERALADLTQREPYDLVLCDPPYDDVLHAAAVLERLIAAGSIAAEGRLVLEHASRDPTPPLRGAELVRTRTYGDTAVSYYRPTAD